MLSLEGRHHLIGLVPRPLTQRVRHAFSVTFVIHRYRESFFFLSLF